MRKSTIVSLDPGEYQALLARQHGCCAACFQLADGEKLVIESEQGIALVHSRCKNIIDLAKESPALLRLLAGYLEKNRE